MIEIKDTTIGYSTPLLDIDHMRLETGHVYVLIGKNGIGKSTFLRSINGEINPIKGEIQIGGQRSNDLTNSTRAKTLSFTAAGFKGIPFLSTFDYVALGRTPHTGVLGRLNAVDQEQIRQALEITGISHLSGRYTDQLSDGERQLATIAKSLAQQTPIILLDEPSAFLDYLNKRTLMQTLKRIAAAENKCIVLSSHDIDICLEVGTPILLVDQSIKKIYTAEDNASKPSVLHRAFGIE
jgi:iron complex transport system ATP-binding protein